VLGFAIIVLALPLAYAVGDSPEGSARPARTAQTAAPLAPIRPLFRAPAFYLLAIGSMCSIAAVGGTNQNLKLYLSVDKAYSQASAAGILSTILAVSIGGRLLMGCLADVMPRKHVMLLIYALIAGSIPLLLVAESPVAMYLFAVVFGLGLGGEYMIIPLMAAELFGVRILGRLMGLILTADGVAEAATPMFIGHVRDVTGSYRPGFLILITVALAGTMAIALLPRTAFAAEASHV
jgi:MFS family permease